jgi:hypothetical protein
MAFSVVEWFVFVFAVLALVKLIIVSFNPKTWLNIVKPLYKSHVILFIVELILAAILFYYLLMSLTIVQIFGGIVLGALLTGMTFAIYGKETIAWAEKLLKGKTILKKAWLPLLIWLALTVWVLLALF